MKTKLRKFSSNPNILRKSKNLGIPAKLFKQISEKFVNEATLGNIPRITATQLFSSFTENDDHRKIYEILTYQIKKRLILFYHKDSIDKALESAFFIFAEPFIPKDKVEKFHSLRSISDIRFPSEWFPDARQMKR